MRARSPGRRERTVLGRTDATEDAASGFAVVRRAREIILKPALGTQHDQQVAPGRAEAHPAERAPAAAHVELVGRRVVVQRREGGPLDAVHEAVVQLAADAPALAVGPD